MSRAREFLHLYNQLDAYLRERTGRPPRSTSFARVVKTAAKTDRTVRRFRPRLEHLHRLRNVLVHDGLYGPEPIAEPSERVLADFADIVERIMDPPRARTAGSEPREIFKPNQPLAHALRQMREGDFSQVVVQDDDGPAALLTAEGIARWLEDRAADPSINLEGTTIGDVLALEPPETFRVVHPETTVDEVRAAFEEAFELLGVRLYAVLVTRSGRGRDKVMRIVTPWDLLGAG